MIMLVFFFFSVNIILSFSSLIFSSVVTISFYILSKKFFLTRQGLSDARVASVTKKNMILQYIFYIDSQSLEIQYRIND